MGIHGAFYMHKEIAQCLQFSPNYILVEVESRRDCEMRVTGIR